jgi:hypothetical protein
MSLNRALSCVLGVALLILPVRPGDAASETDLTWIGSLPGFALKDQAPGETSYLVSGDATAAFEALKKGLAERGWQITPAKSGSLSALSARRMTATKGDVEALLHMKQAAVIVKLVVTTRTIASAGAPTPAGLKTAPPAAPAPAAAPAAGPPIELYDNGLRGSYRCDGSRVGVNGNNCDITLEGTCESVAVNGNANRVRVLARVRSISVLGNSNTVTWSRAQNPSAPKVSNLGAASTVREE